MKKLGKTLRIFATLILTILIGQLSSIANQEAVDPLFKDLSAIETKITTNFGADFPNPLKPAVMNAGAGKAISADIYSLRDKIADASLKRKKDSEIRAFSKVVLGYINIQDKILLNYFAWAHKSAGAESSFNLNMLDGLNLKIASDVARNFYHDKTLHLANRIQHDQNNPTEWSVLKIDAISTIALETQVLNARVGTITKSDGSYEIKDYLKLVQLSVLNERLQNHRILERYLGPFATPNLTNCAPNLVSVRETDKPRGIYESMRAPDLSESFTDVYLKPVISTLQNVRLVPQSQFAAFLDDFLNPFTEYARLKIPPQGRVEIENQFKIWEVEQAKTWNDKSKLAIESSNYTADLWTAAAVAKRIAISSYEFQKNEFKILLNAAAKFYMTDSFTNDSLTIQKAIESYVEKKLGSRKEDFIKQTTLTIQNIIASKSNVAAFQKNIAGRRLDLEKRLAVDIEDLRLGQDIEDGVDSYLANHSSGRSGSSYEISLMKEYPGKRSLPLLAMNFAFSKYNERAPQPAEIGAWLDEKIAETKAPYFSPFAEQYAEKIRDSGRLTYLRQIFVRTVFQKGMNLAQKRVMESKNTKTRMADFYLSTADMRQILDDATRSVLADYLVAITTKPKPVQEPVEPKAKKSDSPFDSLAANANKNFAYSESTGVVRPKPVALDNIYYIEPGADRDAHIRLVVEMFSMIHQGAVAAKALNYTRPNFPRKSNGVPNFINHTSIDQNFEPYRDVNNPMSLSILDVKILAKIRMNAAMDKNAIFRAPMTPDLTPDDDGYRTFADQIKNNYLSVQPALLTLFTNASTRSIGMINSACQAQPLVQGDEKFRHLFRSAEFLRKGLTANDPTLQGVDELASRFVRSRWERVKEDWLEPIAGIAGVIFLIVMIIYCWPLASQAISYLSTGVATMSTTAELMATIGAGTAKGAWYITLASFLCGSTMTGVLTATMISVPIAKIYLNVWELPAQLKYQINANAANIGAYEAGISKPQDLKDFAKAVRTQPYWSAGEIALYTVPFIPGWVRSIRTMTGVRTASQLSILEKSIGEVENLSLAANSTNSGLKGFQEWVSTSGPLRGTYSYLMQQWYSVFKFGRILTLKPNIQMSEVYNLFGHNLVKWIDTDARMIKIFTGRLNQLQGEIEFHINIAKRLGLEVRTGEYVSANANINFKDLMSGTISKYFGTSKEYKQLIFDYKLLLRSEPKPLGLSYDPATKALVVLEDAGVIITDAKDAAQFKALLHVLHANSALQKQLQVTSLMEKLTMKVVNGDVALTNIAPTRVHTLDSFIHSLNPNEWGTMLETLREFYKWERGWNIIIPKIQKFIHPEFPSRNYWEDMGFWSDEIKDLGKKLKAIEAVLDETQVIDATRTAWNAKRAAQSAGGAEKQAKDFADHFESQWGYGDHWAFSDDAENIAPDFEDDAFSYWEYFMTGGKK